MKAYILYGIIFIILLVNEVVYFKVAAKFNIIDKPNKRSSHSKLVLRGGGIIFPIGLWIWSAIFGFPYPWLLTAVTLAAGISFIDDIHSLSDSIRLVIQFIAIFLMIQEIGFLQIDLWWLIIIALIAFVGAMNIFNFMDGINGIMGGYSLAMLIPMLLIEHTRVNFIDSSFLIVMTLGVLVFCIFNFRPKGKAKCFAGDVGSIGMAMIVLFATAKLIAKTGDFAWFPILWMVYGIDGVLTICHRIILHEKLGLAHRKHAYQLMVNELRIGHVKVSVLYMVLQMVISLGAIYLVPENQFIHWLYTFIVATILIIAYVLFKKKYYYLHEEYLTTLEK
nr:glycosyltransferase family 4 protein [uncultured Prevotella sp.]